MEVILIGIFRGCLERFGNILGGYIFVEERFIMNCIVFGQVVLNL